MGVIQINIALDLDGTIDSYPRVFQTLMSSLTAGGNHCYIITGIEEDTVTKADVAAKKEYLTSLGIGMECYYALIVVPQPHADNKVAAIKANDIDMLFDNSKENIKAALPYCVAAMIWNSKTD